MSRLLENYHRLVEKVDSLCEGIASMLGESLTCHPGCSSCCLAISVFPVEAVALIEAANRLTPGQLKHLKQHLEGWKPGDTCPLLEESRCLLYEARPIICRTHGLPILISEPGGKRVDVCPLNCHGLEKIPGNAMVDLERLNTMLVAVNSLYMKEFGTTMPERIPISSLVKILP